MVKTCVSCRFLVKEDWGGGLSFNACGHPGADPGYDVVFGYKNSLTPCRGVRRKHLKCGPTGKWWEAAPVAPAEVKVGWFERLFGA